MGEARHPALGLLADTFHMHIEERDPAAALRNAAGSIVHFHASENHRGCPGKGQVQWRNVAAALKSLDYQGDIVVESFGQGIPELAAATRIWRDVTGDPMRLAAEGIGFLKELLGEP